MLVIAIHHEPHPEPNNEPHHEPNPQPHELCATIPSYQSNEN